MTLTTLHDPTTLTRPFDQLDAAEREVILHMTFTPAELLALIRRHSNSHAVWPVTVEAQQGKLSPTSLALWMRTTIQLELDRIVKAELHPGEIDEIEARS